MWSTLFSIAFTIAGCFAISTIPSIVINVHWAKVKLTEKATGDHSLVFVGLESIVYVSGPCDVYGCTTRSFPYEKTKHTWPNMFIDTGMDGCRAAAAGTAFGAYTTCATLLFALMGTMNRMRFSADANIQKALGMITDMCGFISLLLTLIEFGGRCIRDIPTDYGGYTAVVEVGPGYLCYYICLFGALMRAVFHWLTPVPHRGSGCTPKLPEALVKVLDTDGDGKVWPPPTSPRFSKSLPFAGFSLPCTSVKKRCALLLRPVRSLGRSSGTGTSCCSRRKRSACRRCSART